MSLITSTLLAVILAFMQREVIASSVVIVWLSLVVLVAFSRAALVKAYQRSSVEDEFSVHVWLARFRLGVLATGAVWGAAGFVMFPANETHHQMFLVFMLAGLSAGGVIAYSADLLSAILFSITTLLPIDISLFITGDSLSQAMGMAGILYLSFVIVSLYHINRSLSENIVLHLEASAREEKVRISEERFRLLLKHSPVGIFHYDVNLVITYCNQCFADILSDSVEAIIGSNIMSFKDQTILQASKNALSGKLIYYEGQYSAIFSDASKWIDMTCAPSRDETGKIVGGIAIVRDITDRKQAEEMLRISAIAFESQSAMIVTDAHSVILRINRAFTALTGYSTEEVIGKTPHLFSSGRHEEGFFQDMWATLKETGHWQGEIWNRRKDGLIVAEWLTISSVTASDGSVTHYIGTYSNIIENKEALAEIHRLAYYDPLTRLPNRRLLQDRLEQGLTAKARNGLYGSILFLDLDNFKMLNDTRGHDAGDQLLVEVARRLCTTVREGDIVGRLGGDEFVILLENLSAEAEVAALLTKQVGEKVLAALARPYYFDSYEHHCTASIGIRLYRERSTAEELLRHADLAMYQAKNAGRNTLCFFDPSMQAIVRERADNERNLRRAVENRQFKLYFQTQVHNGVIVGAEVLLRWQHPRDELVIPLEFIPLAEKTDLILPIAQWVLENTCAQLKSWKNHPHAQDLHLAVNVSARQFRNSDFVEQVRQALNSNEINPELLMLELTESLILDNVDDTMNKMRELKDIGVRFSLDDFGTGYASFSYLARLPFDQLKIDQSFVQNIGVKSTDAIIVQTIIGMARSMGLEVVAEGVETEEQRAFLEQHGCTVYQGYLFSKPMPIEEFNLLVEL
ncbi:MAG: EAL domain-containing protein [Methylomonas sp.]